MTIHQEGQRQAVQKGRPDWKPDRKKAGRLCYAVVPQHRAESVMIDAGIVRLLFDDSGGLA